MTPLSPLGRIDILTDFERHQMLEAWNDTDRGLPAVVPALFEAQVARTPDAPAVLYEQARELRRAGRRRANRLRTC